MPRTVALRPACRAVHGITLLMSCFNYCAVCPSLKLLLFTGVQSVDIDLAQQKVLVTGDVSQEDILQTVSKTGKKTELWQ